MTDLESYERFNYALRPSKQVERKLLIEGMHALSDAGFPIRTYTYVGMGSIYYADFVLFHKYLYIDRMICVEASAIPRRMRFNRPFRFIKLAMEPASEVPARLGSRTRYLVWLDYDDSLDHSVLEDVALFAAALSPGSILLVTVDAEPRLATGERLRSTDGRPLWDAAVAKLNTESGTLIAPLTAHDLGYNALPRALHRIITSQLNSSVVSRGLLYQQLFNFAYADGAQMLTLGGLIGTHAQVKALRQADVLAHESLNRGAKPRRISVPPLTPREKAWLDSRLPGPLGAKQVAFELRGDHLKNYRQFYKHYPTYFESVA